MTNLTTTCDGCGVVKKETNHWFKLISSPISVEVSLAEDFDDSDEPAGTVQDLCGRNCLMKAWDAAIDELKVVV